MSSLLIKAAQVSGSRLGRFNALSNKKRWFSTKTDGHGSEATASAKKDESSKEHKLFAMALDEILNPPPVYPKYLLHGPQTKVTVLDNGMKIVTEETPSETASTQVWIESGTSFEAPGAYGSAHFLEHMCFKGTSRRTGKSIESEVESKGASLNAYTSREHTVFTADSFSKDTPAMIDLLSDMLFHSKISDRDVDHEKGIILAEKASVEENLHEVCSDYLHASAFQGSPLGRTILGEVADIEKINRDMLVKYVSTHFTGERMVLATVGGVKHESIVEAASRHFGSVPARSNFDTTSHPQSEFIGSSITIRDDTIPEVVGSIAFEGPGWADADYFIFLLLQTHLGSFTAQSGGGNALNSILSEKTADGDLASHFEAFFTCYTNTSLFGCSFSSKYDRVDPFSYELMHTITHFHLMSNEELARAKHRLKTAYLFNYDNLNAAADDLGRQFITIGRKISPIEAFFRIDAITIKDIERVCWQYLRDVDIAYSAVGPIIKFPDYNDWRARTTMM